jgi:hypothetical protein
MPDFARTIGVDYSSAETPTANRADEDRGVGLGSVLRLDSDALPRLAGLRDGHFDGITVPFFGVPGAIRHPAATPLAPSRAFPAASI